MAGVTPESIHADYNGRRRALIRALTTDAEKLFTQADPARENLCLFGYPDGGWSVDVPPEEVPAEIPEPTLGINFARDGMERKDWLALVAAHSDSWLMALAFYKAARLDYEEREDLYLRINRMPTIFEVVTGKAKASGAGAHRKAAAAAARAAREEAGEGGEGGLDGGEGGGGGLGDEEEGQEEGDPCPQCGKGYRSDEFWIACDFCDTWYCGKCAKMTETKAAKVKEWKCEGCK